MKKAFILGGITLGLPLLAENSSSIDSFKKSLDAFESLGIDLKLMIFILVAFFAIILVISVLFLRSISSFAKSMKLKNSLKETSSVWIWTQLIPIWSYIAMPVLFIKLNEQYKAYVLENSSLQLRSYNSIWGWVLYISSILAILRFIIEQPTLDGYLSQILLNKMNFANFIGCVNLISFVGFWVHISEVRKSIEANVKI